MEETVRVLRIIEYVGPRNWVERVVSESIHGTKMIGDDRMIRAATIGEYPEILDRKESE
jgi:hypothetical protein